VTTDKPYRQKLRGTDVVFVAQLNSSVVVLMTLLSHSVQLIHLGMSGRRIFSRGGQIRGLETKVPQRAAGMEPRWGYS